MSDQDKLQYLFIQNLLRSGMTQITPGLERGRRGFFLSLHSIRPFLHSIRRTGQRNIGPTFNTSRGSLLLVLESYNFNHLKVLGAYPKIPLAGDPSPSVFSLRIWRIEG